MTKKSLGYVELEWICPNCDTKNPGPQKTCLSCGMPQPDDVKFEQRAQETLIEDEFSPYSQSGILINNESGVRVAQIFDENIAFEDIDSLFIATSEFSSWKGVIGSNWKILGGTESENLYEMDLNKKYILKKLDAQEGIYKYFKLRIIDYKLNGEDHYPTVEFKFLANE